MRRLTSLAGVAILATVTALLVWQGTAGPTSAGVPDPTVVIDADTTNGACTTLDASRTGAPTSGSYTVGICLTNSDGAPDAFDVRLSWTGPASAPELPNTAPALDDNPDANQGAGPNSLGMMWDCTGFGLNPPTAGASSASIVCNDTTFGTDSQLSASPGLLATLTLEASGAGKVAITVDDASSYNSPAGVTYICGTVGCVGASVTQGAGGGPTATPTTEAATATPTTEGPTATPTVEGPTATPTNTSAAPPTATNTTVPPTATPTTPPVAQKGDVDCNGTINSIDALLILQLVAALLDELECQDAADVNNNGDVTSIDAALVLQLVAGLIDEF
jgi:hypothetical protein